jgi:hypothetical protein
VSSSASSTLSCKVVPDTARSLGSRQVLLPHAERCCIYCSSLFGVGCSCAAGACRKHTRQASISQPLQLPKLSCVNAALAALVAPMLLAVALCCCCCLQDTHQTGSISRRQLKLS